MDITRNDLDTIHNRLGIRIRELRLEQGMTAQNLAEKAGIDRITIYGIETGRQHGRFESLLGLADGLGVSYNDLFSEFVGNFSK